MLLVSLHIATLCRTALPFLDYAVNYNTIVTELCENRDKPALQCNGQCHLKKNVKEQEEREQRDGSRERVSTVDWSCYLASVPAIAPMLSETRLSEYFYTQSTLFRAVAPPLLPPEPDTVPTLIELS